MTRDEGRAIVDRWLGAIAADQPLALDGQGLCMVQSGTDPKLVLELAEDGLALSFTAPLIAIRPAEEGAVFGYALALNLHQRFTRGGVLAYDVAENAIVYSYNQPVGIDAPVDFAILASDISATADLLRADLAEFRAGLGADAPAGAGADRGLSAGDVIITA